MEANQCLENMNYSASENFFFDFPRSIQHTILNNSRMELIRKGSEFKGIKKEENIYNKNESNTNLRAI